MLCSVAPEIILLAIAGLLLAYSPGSGAQADAPAPPASGECLYGASLELRLADAWRRWGLEGERMRDCDAEALQDALEIVRRCGGS